jgi:hypothetical protein
MTYRGNEIPALSRTTIVLWNAGEKSIGHEDLSTNDPLRLQVSEQCRILSVAVTGVSRSVLQFSCSLTEKPSVATIEFDFLDPRDAAVIDVLHTDQHNLLAIRGTIRGIPSGPKLRGRIWALPSSTAKLSTLRLTVFLTFLFGLATGATAFSPEEFLTWPFTSEWVLRATQFTSGVIVCALAVGMLLVTRRQYPKSVARLLTSEDTR